MRGDDEREDGHDGGADGIDAAAIGRLVANVRVKMKCFNVEATGEKCAACGDEIYLTQYEYWAQVSTNRAFVPLFVLCPSCNNLVVGGRY